jgi:hypothetical protein
LRRRLATTFYHVAHGLAVYASNLPSRSRGRPATQDSLRLVANLLQLVIEADALLEIGSGSRNI